MKGAPAKPMSGRRAELGDELAHGLRDEGHVLGREVGDRLDVGERAHR